MKSTRIGIVLGKNSSGEQIGQGNLRKPSEDTRAIDLSPLEPGSYTTEWQVLSMDTHVTDGVLRFTIAAGGQ
jgi:methionine-rich copper-binding protein CopC